MNEDITTAVHFVTHMGQESIIERVTFVVDTFHWCNDIVLDPG